MRTAAQRKRTGSRGARVRACFLLVALGAVSGCAVGPNYQRPAVDVPAAYEGAENWAPAQPSDAAGKGNWWEVYGNAELDALEERISVSNQTLRAAEAQFRLARAQVRYARADFLPTVVAAPAAARTRTSNNKPNSRISAGTTTNDFVLPFDASYEPDVWGRVRRSVEAARATAQATAADLESVRLSLHAELAMDYFQARSLDAEIQLLNSTVSSFEKALELTESRHAGGLASEVDVAQARTQLEATRAQAIDLQVERTALEHAIATLIGMPAPQFSLPVAPLASLPTVIPPGIPSGLLERRPDIAAAERRVAAANAGIGIARSAYFPLISLAGSGGFESSAITTLIQGPSSLWSVGAGALETAFDPGRRRSLSEQAMAAYDQTVANYRQTVLTAFQEVEDNLAALRILTEEARQQQQAVSAAEQSLALSNNRYRGGVAAYLEVTTAQSAALAEEVTAVEIAGRRMIASVLLIKALGGGWNVAKLPAIAGDAPAPFTPGLLAARTSPALPR